MSELSDALLARLRDHVGHSVARCSICRPEDGIYCLRAERDALAFAWLRQQQVMARQRPPLEWIRPESIREES